MILTHLLTLKFGRVSESVQQRLQQADPDTLLHWSARVLTATCVEDVIGETDPPPT